MMKINKTLVISTLLGIAQSIQECPMEIYHQKVDGKDICKVTCPECDPGNEPVTPCHDIVRTRTFQIGCKSCSAGRYKDKHGSHACQSCVEKCPENHIPTSQCNATTPLRCECRPRYFLRESNGNCVSCCEKLTLLDEIEKCKDVIETCDTGIPIKTTNKPRVSTALKLPSSPVNGTVTNGFWIAIGILIAIAILLVAVGIVAYKRNVCRKKVTKPREEHELQSINIVNDGYAETLSGNDAAAPLLSVHTDGQIARQPSVSEDSTMQYQDSEFKASQQDDDNLSCGGERREDWGTDVLGTPDLTMTHHDSTTSSHIVQAEITPGLKIPPQIPPSATTLQFNAPITVHITNTSISPSEICTKDKIVNSGLNKLVNPDLNNEDSKLCVRKKLVEAKPSCHFCPQDIPDSRLFSENGDVPSTTTVVREVEKNLSSDKICELINNFQTLVFPVSFQTPVKDFRTLLEKISVYIPEFTVASLYYWFYLEGRNDVAMFLHKKYHVSHEDG